MWNPAFDITPAWLIEGIVTERTCLYKNKRGEKDQTGAAFDIGRHVEEIEAMDGTMKKKKKVDEMDASKEKDDSAVDVDGFYALNLSTVLDYVAYYPKVCAPIGGKASREDWVSKEVGDGEYQFCVHNNEQKNECSHRSKTRVTIREMRGRIVAVDARTRAI